MDSIELPSDLADFENQIRRDLGSISSELENDQSGLLKLGTMDSNWDKSIFKSGNMSALDRTGSILPLLKKSDQSISQKESSNRKSTSGSAFGSVDSKKKSARRKGDKKDSGRLSQTRLTFAEMKARIQADRMDSIDGKAEEK
jgi:hypothetical protein